MHAELLMIGTELLLGQIVDTNSAWMGQTLAEHGVNIYQKTTVGDNKARIMAALDAALNRGAIVLCSGGLGPTEDDITRECIAELLGRPLEFREDLYEEILQRFTQVRHLITENNKRQATLPEGAIAITNPRGTAPGVIVEDPRGTIICMPGVPHELKGMMHDSVLPYLKERFSVSGTLRYRVLKVCGVGESRVDALIADIINAHTNPSIGLLASPEAVRIRIAARAGTAEDADALIAPVAASIEERLADQVMGYDDDTVEKVVARLLEERGWSLAIGETETGGKLAQLMSSTASPAFAGAKVLPALASGEGPAPLGGGIDWCRGLLLEFAAVSGLVLLADAEAGRTLGTFVSPSGTHEFEIGHYGGGVLHQTRVSVWALEQVRRYLTGAR